MAETRGRALRSSLPAFLPFLAHGATNSPRLARSFSRRRSVVAASLRRSACGAQAAAASAVATADAAAADCTAAAVGTAAADLWADGGW